MERGRLQHQFLDLEEYDLYRFLQENNFRLEQEQIPNEDSIKKIKQTVV